MKKFLIYVDILGFEELGKGSKFPTEEEIKKLCVERVQNKINELKNTEEIKRCEKQSPDSWLLFAEEISDVFSSISKILETKLQFEIAIGCKEFKNSHSSEELLSLRGETISFLKNDILSPYKSKYKDEHNGESIKETFIVITDDFYNELKNFDEQLCKNLCDEKHFHSKSVKKIVKKTIEEIKNKSLFYKWLLISADFEFFKLFVPGIVVKAFDELPENIRNLLFKLAEKDSAAGVVASEIVKNFDKLPADVRNELLLKLADKDSAAEEVVRVVVNNFDKLPDTVRNLLFKLAEKDSTARNVANTIIYAFDKLPDKFRVELLLKLAEKDSATKAVVYIIVNNSDKLPENIRNLLFTDKLQKVLKEIIKELLKNECISGLGLIPLPNSMDSHSMVEEEAEKFKKFLKNNE